MTTTTSPIGQRGVAENMMFNFTIAAINGDLATVTDDDGGTHEMPATEAVEGIARRDAAIAKAEAEAPARQAAYEARQAAYEKRHAEITAAVMAAIKTGEASAHDTGTESYNETTLYGKGFVIIAVLPRYNARLGHVCGRLKIDSPQVAKDFIDSAAANSNGIK